MKRVVVKARAGASATIIEGEAALVIVLDGGKGTTWRDGNPDRYSEFLPALFDRYAKQGNASQELACLLLALPDELIEEARLLMLKSRYKGGSR